RLHLFNLYKENLGNPQVPEKLKRGRRSKPASGIRPIIFYRSHNVALIVACCVCAADVVISALVFFRRTSPSPSIAARPEAKATSRPTAIPEKSIALLPLANMSHEKQKY